MMILVDLRQVAIAIALRYRCQQIATVAQARLMNEACGAVWVSRLWHPRDGIDDKKHIPQISRFFVVLPQECHVR